MSSQVQPIEDHEILTANETAAILRTTPESLAQMRFNGRGPIFVKHGRAVRYLRSDITEYVNCNRYARTDQPVNS